MIKTRSTDKRSVRILQYVSAAIFLYLAYFGMQKDRSDMIVLVFALMAGVSFSPAVASTIDNIIIKGGELFPWNNKK